MPKWISKHWVLAVSVDTVTSGGTGVKARWLRDRNAFAQRWFGRPCWSSAKGLRLLHFLRRLTDVMFIIPLQPSGYLIHQKVTSKNSTFCPYSAFVRFVWTSEQTLVIYLHSNTWLVRITVTVWVCWTARTESLRTFQINLLKTKRNLFYIRNQSVPHSKHFPPCL